jgi:hypothetical protein
MLISFILEMCARLLWHFYFKTTPLSIPYTSPVCRWISYKNFKDTQISIFIYKDFTDTKFTYWYESSVQDHCGVEVVAHLVEDSTAL